MKVKQEVEPTGVSAESPRPAPMKAKVSELEPRQIRLTLNNGYRMVDALCFDVFGLHKYFGVWRITHTPTGLAVGDVNGDEQRAVDVLNEILTLGFDWNFSSPRSHKFVRVIKKPVSALRLTLREQGWIM